MELVGDVRSTDPILKGCYGDSFLYSDVDLGRLRWCGIQLPPYRSEIPAPLASSYLQAKQSEAMKQSPPWAVMLNPAVESPKTKRSGSKGGHHRSLGCSYNGSRPQQSHAQHPQPRRIPPCVQHLACWCVHIWTIFSPPDYRPGQQSVQTGR